MLVDYDPDMWKKVKSTVGLSVHGISVDDDVWVLTYKFDGNPIQKAKVNKITIEKDIKGTVKALYHVQVYGKGDEGSMLSSRSSVYLSPEEAAAKLVKEATNRYLNG